jgi:hypothetical protein
VRMDNLDVCLLGRYCFGRLDGLVNVHFYSVCSCLEFCEGGGGGVGCSQLSMPLGGNQTSSNRHPNFILLVTCDQLVHKLNAHIEVSCG